MRWSGDIIQYIIEGKRIGRKFLAVLIDPDKVGDKQLEDLISSCERARVDFIFAGGSLIVNPDRFHNTLKNIRSLTSIPLVLFPGSPMQVNTEANAILFLSLISGRNPELLIGHHVTAAPYLKNAGLEIISTGYILIDGGNPTTASYMSGTFPIPSNKPEIAAGTALAGEMLGMQIMYLDGGSGAASMVPAQVIRAVAREVKVPVIVGGGIRDSESCATAYAAGADLVVIGTATESAPERISGMATIRDLLSKSSAEPQLQSDSQV